MKNPLIKRLPRELKSEIGKYLIIFLFLLAAIGFVSGFLVAGKSMKQAYDESFEKYRIEDGHFALEEQMTRTCKKQLEKEDLDVYENFYLEESLRENHTIRIFSEREDCNQISLMEGELPEKEDEILIDRLYAENNRIKIGDRLEIREKEYCVSGFAAFSDYSALFKNNTDMMFDAQKFTVASVTKETFENMEKEHIYYGYSWRNRKEGLSEKEAGEKADQILDILRENAVVKDFVKRADNQAITFTGDDMGSDKVMITWLLYIIICILAFIFAVTITDTIEKEAAVIGTLRAMGYSKGELIRHYLILPEIVFAVAAIVGNILGYTLMKQVVVGMYYGSYSLPAYRTVWSTEAFLLTTVVPCIILSVINLLVLIQKLSYTPLQFLRRDLKKKGRRRTVRLRAGSFFTRFRLRIIFQNKPAYLTMFVGILFANFLLLFGLMMSPLLQHFKKDVLDSSIAKYQYVLKVPLSEEEEDYSVSGLLSEMILKAPVSTGESTAEKYAVTSLENKQSEEIMVYGVKRESAYLKHADLPLKKGEVLVSEGYLEKYGIKEGDTIVLEEKYAEDSYQFTVAGVYHYPPALAVFMTIENYREVFGLEEDAFNGYFTDRKLKDIGQEWIASVITEDDLTIVADQLEDSMGQMFLLICGFAVFIYVLILFLLAKVVIEKNALSISLVKILGYQDAEIGKLYSRSTTIVVVFSLLAGIPISEIVMKYLYRIFMFDIRGWLTFYINPVIYPAMFLIGIAVYVLADFRLSRKIQKIPMENALKNTE